MCTVAGLAACRQQTKYCASPCRESLVVTWASVYSSLNIVMPSTSTLFVHYRSHDKCGMTAKLTSDQLTVQGGEDLSMDLVSIPKSPASSEKPLIFGHSHGRNSHPGTVNICTKPCQLSKDLDLPPICQARVIPSKRGPLGCQQWLSTVIISERWHDCLNVDGSLACVGLEASTLLDQWWAVICHAVIHHAVICHAGLLGFCQAAITLLGFGQTTTRLLGVCWAVICQLCEAHGKTPGWIWQWEGLHRLIQVYRPVVLPRQNRQQDL